MEKIVIFDWGGVILKEYPAHYCDRDAIVDSIIYFDEDYTAEDAYKLYLNTLCDFDDNYICMYDDYENKYKWFDRLKTKGEVKNINYDDFIKVFRNNYLKIDKYEDVVNYIYSLKGKCHLCLFTDLIFTCYDALCKQIDLDVFDDVFLSFKDHFTKRNVDAYKYVLDSLGCSPSDILFIDNNIDNINKAESLGWNVVYANGLELDMIKEKVSSFLGE